MTDKKRTASLDWEDVRFFAALARNGTLAASARALKVTHATVARRLANLEATLGHALFTRSATGFTLNAAGAVVMDEAAQMEMAAGALSDQRESQGRISGLVRITLARVFADGFLAERLAPLHAQHPELEVELVATSRNLSLARGVARRANSQSAQAAAARGGAGVALLPGMLARVRTVADYLGELFHAAGSAAT